jgi:succinylarginine dihydrolase
MRHNLRLGLAQGLLLPHRRPDRAWLAELGTTSRKSRPRSRRRLLGLGDVGGQRRHRLPRARHGRRPLPPHRRQPKDHGAPQPRMAGDARPAPPRLRRRARLRRAPAGAATFGDEGAANHMRLAAAHDAPGVEIFVYGARGGAFPVRQHEEASRAVARFHGLDRSAACSSASPSARSPPAPSTTTSSPSPTSMSSSPTSSPSRTGTASTPS